MTAYETILLERKRRVAVLTLNRPEALNALNLQVMTEVVGAAEELDRDPDVGCIVLTGSAKAFAAGADIKEMRPRTYMDMYLSDWFTAWDRLARAAPPPWRPFPATPSAAAASWPCSATSRTPPVPRRVRHGRPEGGHVRLRGQAAAALHPRLSATPVSGRSRAVLTPGRGRLLEEAVGPDRRPA